MQNIKVFMVYSYVEYAFGTFEGAH